MDQPMDQEPDDDENLSSEEETCFTREVTEHTSQGLKILLYIGKN